MLPHDGVCARLKPSKIHGIGVFAILDIKRGQRIFKYDDEPIIWVDERRLKNLPIAIRRLYRDFGIYKQKKYGVPNRLDNLTVSWYLNHSTKPNVVVKKDYQFFAIRNIRTGEELTVNYHTYSDTPKGLLYDVKVASRYPARGKT